MRHSILKMLIIFPGNLCEKVKISLFQNLFVLKIRKVILAGKTKFQKSKLISLNYTSCGGMLKRTNGKDEQKKGKN